MITQRIWYNEGECRWHFILNEVRDGVATMLEAGYAESERACQDLIDETLLRLNKAQDERMGKFVYCTQHCRVHATGWCSVRNARKVALPDATTLEEAQSDWELLKIDLKYAF